MPLHWKSPEITDRDWAISLLPQKGILGCDVSFAAMFLWQKMYQTQIAQHNDFLLRRIGDFHTQTGYGFPIGNGDLRTIIEFLEEESATQGNTLNLFAVTEKGKNELESLFPSQFEFSSNPNSCDYVLDRIHLAELSGRKYHKIRNHISQFHRQYPQAEVRNITKENLTDVAEVQRIWLEEHNNITGETRAKSQNYENDALSDALAHFEELHLRGVILYCEDAPAAVSIVSAINEDICDVHFEKAVKPYSDFGAYAAVRKYLVETLDTFEWINLEEDMGLPGLRQAKQAWQPAMLFQKYTAVKKR